MRKNAAIAVICFAAVFIYLACGFLIQAMAGVMEWDEAGFALALSFIIAALVGLGAYAIVSGMRKRFGVATPADATYVPGPAMINSAALAVALSALASGWVSYGRVSEQRTAAMAQAEAQAQAVAKAAAARRAASAAK